MSEIQFQRQIVCAYLPRYVVLLKLLREGVLPAATDKNFFLTVVLYLYDHEPLFMVVRQTDIIIKVGRI